MKRQSLKVACWIALVGCAALGVRSYLACDELEAVYRDQSFVAQTWRGRILLAVGENPLFDHRCALRQTSRDLNTQSDGVFILTHSGMWNFDYVRSGLIVFPLWLPMLLSAAVLALLRWRRKRTAVMGFEVVASEGI